MGDTPFYLQRSDLPVEVLFSDIVNVLDRELVFKHVDEPDSPDANYSILFPDLADGKFKIKKEDGTLLDIEDIITGADTKVTVKEAGVSLGTSALNFTEATDFDIAFSGIDGETTISIADDAIGDNHIAAHTSTKISIANTSQLPALPPSDAQYIVAALHANLSAERVITAGTNVTIDNTVAGLCTINAVLGDGAVADFGTLFKFSGIISPAQITADQNDYAPTGIATANTLRINSNALRNITGISSIANQILLIHNTGTFDIVFKDESSSSTAANRFALNGDLTLKPDQSVLIWYDGTSTRWRASGQWSSTATATTVIDRVTTQVDIVNTSAESTVYSYSLTGGSLGANGILRLTIHGDFLNDSGSNNAFDFILKLGGVVVWKDNSSDFVDAGTQRLPWTLVLYIHNRNSESSQYIGGLLIVGTATAGTTGISFASNDEVNAVSPISATSAINTASTQTLSFHIDHTNAHAQISCRANLIMLEKL
jgi:hypothetical protein